MQPGPGFSQPTGGPAEGVVNVISMVPLRGDMGSKTAYENSIYT